MYTEIEAKLKVDSFGAIEDKLAELGAEFIAEQLQTDYYFDDTAKNLVQSGRGLRLRRQLIENDEKFFLTCKSKKHPSKFKKRHEAEVEVADGDLTEELLELLGYKRALTVEKKRRLWHLAGCEIALDELPLLGKFVEIEGENEKSIANVQNMLGLAHLPHIKTGYAHLIAEKISNKVEP
ncbi:MAG: class IV adenylate cyclase [Planctomycetes bacterium]|nr:class IV adenylate cyclase [Planctomycetota bacterium]MCK5472580.1 class IV adenylate cyclase [Planctomycetota bacterium]